MFVNNVNGVRKESFITPHTILFDNGPRHCYSALLANTTVLAGDDGKKIVKAGTPVTGDITKRETAFTVATGGSASKAIGVLFHDVDVTAGNANVTVMDMGNVDLNKLETETAALITSEVQTALKGRVNFFK